ncbi:hypothetical protein [Streptomyces sp. NPDC055607]
MTVSALHGPYEWHPAADDHLLARACTDARAGLYLTAGEAMRGCWTDMQVRAHRSLVLASEMAGSDLAERWLEESPGPDAALIWARVATIRALRAADASDSRTPALRKIALAACAHASEVAPDDPTPWVVRLALARLEQHRDAAPPYATLTSPAGPWRLFGHILKMDPWHREAHHRFLATFFTRYGGSAGAAWDVVAFLAARAPETSVLRMLPLVVLVETYNPSTPLADRVWEEPQWRDVALKGFEAWFPLVDECRYRPVVDLGHLAHALLMARCAPQAKAVLRAMEPYASRMPWSTFGPPEIELSRARRACRLAAQVGN